MNAALESLIADLEKTFEGGSNEAEHDAAVDLVDYLRAHYSNPRVVVHCDGGLVQGVLSTVPIEYAVMDYDVEGADEDRLTAIPQQDESTTVPAYCYTYPAEVSPERVAQLFAAIEPKEIA